MKCGFDPIADTEYSFLKRKKRIQEKLNLSACADSSIDTIFVITFFGLGFFLKVAMGTTTHKNCLNRATPLYTSTFLSKKKS